MPEYVITPSIKKLPEAPALLEGIHRLGFQAEITLKGTSQTWENIRFYESGPPEIECQVSYDPQADLIRLFVPTDAPPRAFDLQMYLVDLLLGQVGGQADNTKTRERFTAKEFKAKLKHLHAPPSQRSDLVWIGFSWGVVLAGIALYFFVPQDKRVMDLVIVVLAALSAGGMTYFHLKA